MATIEYHARTEAPDFPEIQQSTATRGEEALLSTSELVELLKEILGYDLLEEAPMAEGYREMGAEMLLISESTTGAMFEALPPE